MSKKHLVIIWLIILLIIAGAISMWFFTEKKEATEVIDSYIIEKDYEDNIQEKENILTIIKQSGHLTE